MPTLLFVLLAIALVWLIVRVRETRDELGEELQHYFATANSPLPAKISNEIRNQVIDGVVERILRSWGEPNGQVAASIKSEVIARLVERVTAEILKKGVER